MAPFGVKVACIEPGFFKTNVTDTDILSKSIKTVWDKMPQEVRDDYGTEYLQKGKSGSSFFFFAFFVCLVLMHPFIYSSPFSLLALEIISDKVAKISDGDLMKVVSCMEHAVSAVRPRTRYSPGWDAKFFWLPLSYMPTCVSDYIMTKQSIPIARKEQ